MTDARRLAAVLLTVAAGFFALGVALEEGEGETVLGLDVESTATVVAGVVLSLGLAAGLWFTRHRAVALVAVPVAFAFGVLDLAELAHQVEESSWNLVVLSAVVAAAHLGATVAAATSLSPPHLAGPPPAADFST